MSGNAGTGKVGEVYEFMITVQQGNGDPATGILPGDFTVRVRNMTTGVDDATPAGITEIGGGRYQSEVRAAFSTAEGIGNYNWQVVVSDPPIRGQAEGDVKFELRDQDDLAQPGDDMALTAAALTAIEDEILDADKSLHLTANSYGQQIQNTLQVVHYDGDAISNSNGGAKDDPLGGGNPPTELVTRMDAVGAKVAYLKFLADFLRPTAGVWTNKIFIGSGPGVAGFDPNDIDFNQCRFERLSFQSSLGVGFGAYAAGFGDMIFKECHIIGAIDLQPCIMYDTQLSSNITSPISLATAGDYHFHDCSMFRASGVVQPVVLDFDGGGNTRAFLRNFEGNIIIREMSLGTQFLEISGDYDITIDATCTAGIIRLRGTGVLTNNGAGVTVEDERFDEFASIHVQPGDPAGGNIRLLFWLDRGDRRVTAPTSFIIEVRDQDDNVVLSDAQTAAPDNAHGAYEVLAAVAPVTGDTWTAQVSITDALGTINRRVEGITVG